MIERRLAKLKAGREGLSTILPREMLEEIISLLIQALDFFDDKKDFSRDYICRLIERLEPYKGDRFVSQCRKDLMLYISYDRKKTRISY